VGSERARKHPEALDSSPGASTSSRQKVPEPRGLGYQPVIHATLTGRRHRWLPVRREPIWPWPVEARPAWRPQGQGHVAVDGVRRGASLRGHTASTRFSGHPRLCLWV